jgi:hypothetical protein
VIERTDFDHPSVIDQNVDPAEMIEDLPNSSMDLITTEQIAFDGENSTATTSEISFGAGQFFWITCEEGDLSALIANVSCKDEPKPT